MPIRLPYINVHSTHSSHFHILFLNLGNFPARLLSLRNVNVVPMLVSQLTQPVLIDAQQISGYVDMPCACSWHSHRCLSQNKHHTGDMLGDPYLTPANSLSVVERKRNENSGFGWKAAQQEVINITAIAYGL